MTLMLTIQQAFTTDAIFNTTSNYYKDYIIILYSCYYWERHTKTSAKCQLQAHAAIEFRSIVQSTVQSRVQSPGFVESPTSLNQIYQPFKVVKVLISSRPHQVTLQVNAKCLCCSLNPNLQLKAYCSIILQPFNCDPCNKHSRSTRHLAALWYDWWGWGG